MTRAIGCPVALVIRQTRPRLAAFQSLIWPALTLTAAPCPCSAKTSLSAPASFSVTDMKDQKDKQTGDLLASPDAVRQARYAERMKAKGMRQRKFWLTDDEYEALRECLEELRAAQGGGSDPASA
nr:uncharacterized protein [Enterobacter cloacae subsp. cloacae]